MACLYLEVIPANLRDPDEILCLTCDATRASFSHHQTSGSLLPFLSKMPFKALSERVKALRKSKSKDAKLRKAVDAYSCEQQIPECARRGARPIAKEFGIENQWRTIINRYNGHRSLQEVHEKQQNLTSGEESTLVNFLLESANQGFPQTLRDINNHANLI